jgi:hypothetical protein
MAYLWHGRNSEAILERLRLSEFTEMFRDAENFCGSDSGGSAGARRAGVSHGVAVLDAELEAIIAWNVVEPGHFMPCTP